VLGRADLLTIAAALAITLLAGVLHVMGAGAVVEFVAAGAGLAILATLVGRATEQLGERLGPGATGVLQSALGNLPELFVGIFALRKGLVEVVQASLVGSILGNSLLVLGLAFLIGGLRNGTQRFASEPPRMIATLALLAVAALAVPTLAVGLHTPAGRHAESLSVACAIVLLVIFALSIPFSLRGGGSAVPAHGETDAPHVWPLAVAAGVLAGSGIGAALVSDWFVGALEGATASLGLSQAFTGLVVVAIAGNAVENVVGIQLAARNKPDYAVSVILNSSLQVALGLAPVLVLLSFVIGGEHLTLVLRPLLVAALGMAGIIGAVIVFDGESTWLEGAILIGLYGMIAASFWWG
jgi:Ca2+:H+ antiporter